MKHRTKIEVQPWTHLHIYTCPNDRQNIPSCLQCLEEGSYVSCIVGGLQPERASNVMMSKAHLDSGLLHRFSFYTCVAGGSRDGKDFLIINHACHLQKNWI